MTDIRIKQMTFRGGAGFDGFYISTFSGWDSTPDIRRDATDRPQANGSFDAATYFDARVVEISGSCHADSSGKLASYQKQLSGLFADGGSAQVFVDREGETSWSWGRLQTKTQFDIDLWGSHAAYQLQIWFPDPRKFGIVHTFAGGEVTFHRGNFSAYPVQVVSGSMPGGYTINGPGGRQFIVSRAVTTGHPHTIDMATGLLQVDGAVAYQAVLRPQVWTIPPGEPQVTQTLTPASGSGTLQTLVADTEV